MAIDAAGTTNPVGALIGAVRLFDKGGRDAIQKLEANPAWSDPVALQRILDTDKPATGKLGPALNRWRGTVEKRIAELESQPGQGEEFEPGDYDSPIVGDVPLSPVFGAPVLLGIGASGTDWNKVIRDLAKKDPLTGRKIRPKGLTDAQARRAINIAKDARRAASPAGRLIKAGSVLLAKVPKGLLPDKEVVQVAKTLGRAVRGGFGPLIAQQVGTLAIGKVSRELERIQFEKMEKILGPQDAQAYRLRQMARKGPEKRLGPAPKTGKALAAPRPKAPVAGQPAPPRPKAPPTRPSVAAITPSAPVALKPVIPSGQQLPTVPAAKPAPRIFGDLLKVADLARLSSLLPGETTRAEASRANLANLLPPRLQSVPRFEAAQTGTSSGCYTVCRKPSTGKKKRKAPRVCVSKASARKAGIIK